MYKIKLNIQKESQHARKIPARRLFKHWIEIALQNIALDTLYARHPKINTFELTLRFVDAAESEAFNARYRGKTKPTNILSFTTDNTFSHKIYYLGDLLICVPVVLDEAAQQKKEIAAHFAHLTVHGLLHVLGYDHENTSDAVIMEKLEIAILKCCGFGNPYQEI